MKDICCKGCGPPKRSAEPNCHMTCPEYLAYRAEQDRLLEEQHKRNIIDAGLREQRSKLAHKTMRHGRKG